MKEMKVEVKGVAQYGGHSVRANGSVDFKLDMDYAELTNVMQLLQMLNNDIDVQVKLLDRKGVSKLGVFRLNNVSISHDGTSKVKFNSQTDFVEMDELNKFVTMERFKCRFQAVLEIEEDEDDEE